MTPGSVITVTTSTTIKIDTAEGGNRTAILTRLLQEASESLDDFARSGDDDPDLELWTRACASLLVDATRTSDTRTLKSAAHHIPRLAGARLRLPHPPPSGVFDGVLMALMSSTSAALRRSLGSQLWLESGSHAHRMLALIGRQEGITNNEIAQQLSIDPTEVSRNGRRLRENGLAVARQVGRCNAWELTPNGRDVLAANTSNPDPDGTAEGEDASGTLLRSTIGKLEHSRGKPVGSPLRARTRTQQTDAHGTTPARPTREVLAKANPQRRAATQRVVKPER